MALHFNGKHYSIGGFFLGEPVVPKETDYGTNEDVNNKEILNYVEHYFTFITSYFREKKVFFKIDIEKNTGNVKFGVGDNLIIEYEDYYITRKNSYDAKSYSNTGKVSERIIMNFNKTFYVALQIIKETKMQFFKLWSNDQALGCLYAVVVKNELFQNYLKEHGFEYDKFEDDYHYYKKITRV